MKPTTTPTTTTQAPELVLAPPFDEQQPGEGWQEFSRRACLWLMREGDFANWRLSDEALDAAINGARIASTGRGLSSDVAETLSGLQRSWRSLLNGRQRQAAALRALEAQQAKEAPAAAAPEAPKGGGGSKVPRRPKPTPGAPSAALRVPVAPALRPVAPLTVDADLF